MIAGDDVLLVRVPAPEVDAVLAGRLGGHVAGAGWPHPDTVGALAFARRGGATWLIVDTAADPAGVVVGECGLKSSPDEAGSVEIGYGLAAPSRGRGLGSRAIHALLQRLATCPDVRSVEAETEPTNTASRRLLERLGFTVTNVEPTHVRYALDLRRTGGGSEPGQPSEQG